MSKVVSRIRNGSGRRDDVCTSGLEVSMVSGEVPATLQASERPRAQNPAALRNDQEDVDMIRNSVVLLRRSRAARHAQRDLSARGGWCWQKCRQHAGSIQAGEAVEAVMVAQPNYVTAELINWQRTSGSDYHSSQQASQQLPISKPGTRRAAKATQRIWSAAGPSLAAQKRPLPQVSLWHNA